MIQKLMLPAGVLAAVLAQVELKRADKPLDQIAKEIRRPEGLYTVAASRDSGSVRVLFEPSKEESNRMAREIQRLQEERAELDAAAKSRTNEDAPEEDQKKHLDRKQKAIAKQGKIDKRIRELGHKIKSAGDTVHDEYSLNDLMKVDVWNAVPAGSPLPELPAGSPVIATAGQIPPVVVVTGEKPLTAWLIERNRDGAPEWFSMTLAEDQLWTSDASEGTKFADQATAEGVGNRLFEGHLWQATEHQWLPRSEDVELPFVEQVPAAEQPATPAAPAAVQTPAKSAALREEDGVRFILDVPINKLNSTKNTRLHELAFAIGIQPSGDVGRSDLIQQILDEVTRQYGEA